MGYPVCSNRIHSSGINGPWKSLFETIKSFLGDGHRLKLFLGVWESGARVRKRQFYYYCTTLILTSLFFKEVSFTHYYCIMHNHDWTLHLHGTMVLLLHNSHHPLFLSLHRFTARPGEGSVVITGALNSCNCPHSTPTSQPLQANLDNQQN